MRKFLKWVGVVFCSILLLAFIILLFSDDNGSNKIVYVIMALICVALLVLLLRKKKPRKAKNADQTLEISQQSEDEDESDSIQEKSEKRNAILKTRIVDAYGKISTASAAARGVVGHAVAGPLGGVVGASTAKQNRQTTFLIIYKDGRKKVKTVPNDSFAYHKYIKYLDVE